MPKAFSRLELMTITSASYIQATFIRLRQPETHMSEMIYHGKVKQLWSTDDPDVIEFRYTDQISVFDQIIPSLIPRKENP